METNKGKIFLNTIFWGAVLWLIGYALGFLFFAFVPKGMIGWYIMPFGIVLTLWVLFKKIRRDSFTHYVGLGLIWALMAIVLDYLFLVRMLQATDYYKLDVYLYYVLTFALPLIFGWYKMRPKRS